MLWRPVCLVFRIRGFRAIMKYPTYRIYWDTSVLCWSLICTDLCILCLQSFQLVELACFACTCCTLWPKLTQIIHWSIDMIDCFKSDNSEHWTWTTSCVDLNIQVGIVASIYLALDYILYITVKSLVGFICGFRSRIYFYNIVTPQFYLVLEYKFHCLL